MSWTWSSNIFIISIFIPDVGIHNTRNFPVSLNTNKGNQWRSCDTTSTWVLAPFWKEWVPKHSGFNPQLRNICWYSSDQTMSLIILLNSSYWDAPSKTLHSPFITLGCVIKCFQTARTGQVDGSLALNTNAIFGRYALSHLGQLLMAPCTPTRSPPTPETNPCVDKPLFLHEHHCPIQN